MSVAERLNEKGRVQGQALDPHKIDPSKMDKLEAPERADRLPPDQVLDLLDPSPGMRCVDLGCGTGYLARPLAERVAPGWVLGLDLRRAMLAELMRRSHEASVDVEPLQAAATRLPLGAESTERVLSVNLHHEVDDPAAMLTEVHRVLEPGGRVLVVDWAPTESPTGPPLAYRLPAEAIADQLEQAGFDRLTVHEVFPYHSAVSAARPIG